MAKKKETVEQVLEAARGEQEMSKDEFAEALSISRQWYHQILNNGKDIDLKTLAWLSVDYRGEWRGELADRLIVLWHGEQYVPVGSHDELVKMREFLKTTQFEEMLAVGRTLHSDHFGLWAAELRDRLESQLAHVKAEMKTEVAA